MFTSIKTAYGALGVMLFLVAMYLVLNNSNGARTLITSSSTAGVSIFKVLQGR